MPKRSEKKKTEKKKPTVKPQAKPRRGKKSTQAERIKRLAVIDELLARGVGRAQICKYVMDEWGMSEASTDRFMADVRKAWRSEVEANRKNRLAEATKRREAIYSATMGTKDFRTALAADDSLRKLQGLTEDRVRVIQDDEGASERAAAKRLTDDDLKAIAEMQAKVGHDSTSDTPGDD